MGENIMTHVKTVLAITLVSTLVLASCGNKSFAPDAKFDVNPFDAHEPLEVVERELTYSDYEGGEEKSQSGTLFFYKESAKFSEIYPGVGFTKMMIDADELRIVKVESEYIYFSAVEGGTTKLIRYDMSDGSQKLLFTYDGANTISVADANDDYVVFDEDENANWMKNSINVYDIKSGESRKIWTHPRDENGYSFLGAGGNTLLDGSTVYFDTVTGTDGDGLVYALYKYDIVKDELTELGGDNARSPLNYRGLSWLEDGADNTILKNEKSGELRLGLDAEKFSLAASENLLAASSGDGPRDGVAYFDGSESVPVIQSTAYIDYLSCSDRFITWMINLNDDPIYYDVKADKLISVDCLEKGRRYVGYPSDDYLVFETIERGKDMSADSYIFYFLSSDKLK